MRNLASFQDEMNRLFDQFFRGVNGGEAGWGHYPWTPAVDIYETDEALVLTVDLVRSGTPLVQGVPVGQVMQRLADTLSVDEVRRAYPHLTADDVRAALAYAAASADATPS
jgi:uncharacterized protein (DUF433 family)